MSNKAFIKVQKKLEKKKPVVILCFEEERKTALEDDRDTNSGSTHRTPQLPQQQQQLFEEDVRVAVRRSAEQRGEQQRKTQKAQAKEALRTQSFVEMCTNEENEAKLRKERLILTGKWRTIATRLHNEKQTRHAHWSCPECTVENFWHENKCHVCLVDRKGPSSRNNNNNNNNNNNYNNYNNYNYGRSSSALVVLPPILALFGLEGFSGTYQVASIRAMVGSRYRLESQSAKLIHLPPMLEGSTLCGSKGSSVLDGSVECAFAASDVSRVVVGIHPTVILRGAPDWLQNYTQVENDVILVDNGAHYGIYVHKQVMQRGDVFECIAVREVVCGEGEALPSPMHRRDTYAHGQSDASLCIWFVMDGRTEIEL